MHGLVCQILQTKIYLKLPQHVGKIPYSTTIRFHFANNNFIWFQCFNSPWLVAYWFKKRMPEEPATGAFIIFSVSVVGKQWKSRLLLEQKWSESKANLKISRFRKHSTEVVVPTIFVCRCLCTKNGWTTPPNNEATKEPENGSCRRELVGTRPWPHSRPSALPITKLEEHIWGQLLKWWVSPTTHGVFLQTWSFLRVWNGGVPPLKETPIYPLVLEDHAKNGGKLLGSPPFISHGDRPFGKGITPVRGRKLAMVINHLLTGMILHVEKM